MRKVIVSGGCSFAYGFNLKDRNRRYSKTLANYYDKDLIDVSVAGSSNENIGSCVATGIHRALQRYDKDKIVVIIGWTDMMRYEFFNKRLRYPQALYIDRTTHNHGNKITSEVEECATFVTERLWTPEWAYYKLVHAFNYTTNICKAHNIPIIHTANIPLLEFPFGVYNVAYSDNNAMAYTEQVIMPEDKLAFNSLFEYDTFADMTNEDCNLYQIDPGRDSHPSEAGHMEWTKRLINRYGNILGT